MPKRDTYTCQDGTELTLGSVSVQQMLVRKQIPPQMLEDIDAAVADKTLEKRGVNGEFRDFYDAVIAQGVIAPEIHLGSRATTPPSGLHVMDLGDEYMAVANRILALSGLMEEAEQAARFRDGVGAGGDGAGPGAHDGADADGSARDEPRRVVRGNRAHRARATGSR